MPPPAEPTATKPAPHRVGAPAEKTIFIENSFGANGFASWAAHRARFTPPPPAPTASQSAFHHLTAPAEQLFSLKMVSVRTDGCRGGCVVHALQAASPARGGALGLPAMTLGSMSLIAAGPLFGLLVIVCGSLLSGALAARWGAPRFVGGVIVGLLLGATVLGHVWPSAHQLAIGGGYSQQRAMQEERAKYDRDRAALVDSGVTDVAVDELDAAHRDRTRILRGQMTHAQTRASSRWWDLTLALGSLLLISAGFQARPLRFSELWLPGLPIAIVATALVANFTVLGHWLFDNAMYAELVAALAITCVATALPVSPAVRRALASGQGVHPLVDLPQVALAGAVMLNVVAFIAARLTVYSTSAPVAGSRAAITYSIVIGAALVALLVVRPVVGWLTTRASRTTRDLVITAIGSCLFVGAALPGNAHNAGAYVWPAVLVIALALSAGGRPNFSRRAFDILSPIVAAIIMLRLDITTHLDWLLLLGVLVLYGDVKAIGAMLAARFIANRSWWDSLRLGTALAAGGVVPLMLAAMLHETQLLGDGLFTALALAITITAMLATPMLKLIDRLDRPTAE